MSEQVPDPRSVRIEYLKEKEKISPLAPDELDELNSLVKELVREELDDLYPKGREGKGRRYHDDDDDDDDED
jgi:hypothetical protein